MPTYFVDTWFWIALIDKKSDEHEQAESISREIGNENTLLLTSEMVFTELLAYFSKKEQCLREAASELVQELFQRDAQITIVHQTHDQFERALGRYRKFKDKQWSLTDCASMLIMDAHSITTAITNDHHFTQAGYNIKNS
ncbi:MAG: PIN domain-containing protein [Anaerolineales bacterium]